jgi:GNAT superfamily N-acetyltransferase
MKVMRARIEEVQPLAAAYRRESDSGATLDPALPAGAVFWIARSDEGDQVGYAAGSLRPEGLVLGPVFVLRHHRRGGVGRVLLGEIQRWADGARIPVVEVSVGADNTAGVRFLESAGYAVRRYLMARGDAAAAAPAAVTAELEDADEEARS